MRIIDVEDIKDASVFRKTYTVDGITFLSLDECKVVLEASNNNLETIKKWFDLIGVKYDDININNGTYITYSVNKNILQLADLSSGERYVLYLMACKNLKKKVIANGLFERLCSRLQKVVCNELADYDNLVVVYYNDFPIELKEYIVEEI